MTEVGMHEAKTNLSKLVERALAGEEIVITRRGIPAVRLVPERPKIPFREMRGALKSGLASMSWEEWKALDEEIEEIFDAAIEEKLEAEERDHEV